MKLLHYILDGKKPVAVDDFLAWGQWFETADRVVKQEWVDVRGVEARVSTVFLGLDHNWSEDGPPILFETMVFSSIMRLNGVQRRYATWEEAEAGHAAMVAEVRGKLEAQGIIRPTLEWFRKYFKRGRR